VRRQSHELPILCQLTSLGSHSVLMEDMSLRTSFEAHRGQGGAGLADVERYSSKRVSQAAQRYS
jgi:hypothetical protein